MTTPSDSLPIDLAAAHAMIVAQREMLAQARSEANVRALEIERLKLMLAKMRRPQTPLGGVQTDDLPNR